MKYINLFNENDWNMVCYSPFVVFVLVAGYDGNISVDDTQIFSTSLTECRSSLMIEALTSAGDSPGEMLSEAVNNLDDCPILLQGVDEALERSVPESVSQQFKKELMEIANALANNTRKSK